MPKLIYEAMMGPMRRLPHTIPGVAVFFCTVASLGCSPARSAEDPSTPREGRESDASAERGADETTSGSSDLSRRAGGPHPLLDNREPRPDAALPRLTYKHLGMHIGGESNSPESKRPWLDDIERSEDSLLSCFRFVREPQKGGSYGVDLYVGTQGGAPEVRGSRQKMGDEEFDQCMKRAFGTIKFHKPERPTVFSYSIYFKLEDNASH